MPTPDSRPANGARAPFPKKPRLNLPKRLRTPDTQVVEVQTHHEKLMEASPAYREWHTREVPVRAPDIAETIAQSVAVQCNAWAGRLFDREKCPYPANGLLEEVIAKLQSRV